ncbi:MAG: hypothetical protein VKJ09_06135 [Leptolyngbya sp.]|nr:hypothetical protein [Leptolyngbya sp.]
MSKSSPTKKSLLSTTNLILIGLAWGIIALLFFLLFSVPPPGQEQADWYFVGITLLETGAFFVSALFCFRNWQSGQIVSGRNVWLWIGIGLSCYTLGNVLFYLWGNVWGKDPAVSPGDVFYLLSYVFLAGGMLQAVLPRRLNLEFKQWGIVALVGISGIALAYFLNYVYEPPADLVTDSVAIEEASVPTEASAPTAASAPAASVPADAVDPNAASVPTDAPAAPASTAPAWVVKTDAALEPFEGFVTAFYLVGDCLLLVVAATLLVAFWGGRFSQSWKLIAVAAFCLYIADMFFAFYVNQAYYEEGQLWEVFWTFSALFFGMGAVVEHAISTQSRRSPRRRRLG